MPENPHHRRILRLIGGGAIGLAIAWGLTTSGALQQVARWQPAEIVSTALAGGLLMVSFITGIGATNRNSYRALTDDGLDEPVEPVMLSILRRQAVVTAILGLLLLVPPAAAHAGFAGTTAVIPIAVMVLLIAAQTWLHLGLIRDGDELTRTVSVESGWASFWVTGLALFGWASLEKLALLSSLDSWTMLTALMGLSLIASVVVSARRGFVGR